MRLAALFASAVLAAQTTIPPGQLRPSTADPIRLLAVTVDGFRLLEVGPGIAMVDGRLVAAERKPVQPRIEVTAAPRRPDGSYQVAPGCMVSRNGLLQSPTADYGHTADIVRPQLAWSAEDLVLAICARVE